MDVNHRTDWQVGDKVYCESKRRTERFSGTVMGVAYKGDEVEGLWVSNPWGRYFAKYELFHVFPAREKEVAKNET